MKRSAGGLSQSVQEKVPKQNRIKYRERYILGFFFVLFLLYAFTLVFPFLWLFYNSLKRATEFLNSPLAFPEKFLFSNYIEVFKREDFNLPAMFFNSTTLVVGQVFVSLLVHACTAYVVSKYKFPGRNIVYFVAIIIMFIPTTGSLAVYYRFQINTGMYDTYWGMIISSAGGFGFNFLLLYGYFKNISWNYAEAAFIDGAGNWTVFLRIMLPQAVPALVSLGIIGGIGIWNDFMGQYLFYPSHTTVSVGIRQLSESIVSYNLEYPKFFAATILCTLPVLIVYACFQKTITRNTVAGGLKG